MWTRSARRHEAHRLDRDLKLGAVPSREAANSCSRSREVVPLLSEALSIFCSPRDQKFERKREAAKSKQAKPIGPEAFRGKTDLESGRGVVKGASWGLACCHCAVTLGIRVAARQATLDLTDQPSPQFPCTSTALLSLTNTRHSKPATKTKLAIPNSRPTLRQQYTWTRDGLSAVLL